MKVTGRSRDPDYWRINFATCPTILLDGQVIEHVAIADDVEGYVVVEIHDENGKIQVGDGRIATQCIKGKVEIVGERRTEAKTFAELKAMDFMRDVMEEEEGVE